MPAFLEDLAITRVAAVDRGAGDGVRVVMFKRDAPAGAAGLYVSLEKSELSDDAVVYLKREFSPDKRKELARSGHAMADGGFPIENVSDLKNAIQAIGRAKNPRAAKQHIIRRARALGQSDLIPEDWTKTQPAKKTVLSVDAFDAAAVAKACGDAFANAIPGIHAAARAGLVAKDGAVDFDQAEAQQAVSRAAAGLMDAVRMSVNALDRAIFSIAIDDEADDPDALISESFDQFRAHLAGLGLEDVGKAIAADLRAAHPYAKEHPAMKPEEIAKAIADGVAASTKSLNEALAKQAETIAILQMSPAEKAHYDGLATDELKKAFVAKAAKDRKAEMDDDEDDKTSKSLPAEIKKALGVAASAIEKNVALEKQVNVLLGDKHLQAFSKRAIDIGLTEADGQMLMKAHGGDAASITALEDRLKALNAQIATGALFQEFGKGGQPQGNGTAYGEIRAKAEDLVKTEKAAGRTISVHQAVSKVMVDPANQDLVQRNKREEMAKRFPRAA